VRCSSLSLGPLSLTCRWTLTPAAAAAASSINKWTPVQREKIAYSAGLIIAQGFASLELFQNLTKEHLLKDCERSLVPPLPSFRP
jgi:hypothetical protein